MRETEANVITFASLDKAAGINELPQAEADEFPLPAWYRGVWHTPLEKLTLKDICRAVDQNIYAEHIVPIAIKILRADPLAGDMYDGHLLSSLTQIPEAFWQDHQEQRNAMMKICQRVLMVHDLPDDIRRTIKSLAKNLAWDWSLRAV